MEQMPAFDEWGLRLVGLMGPRENPIVVVPLPAAGAELSLSVDAGGRAPLGADGEGEAEEDEALGRGVDLGLHREVLAVEPGAVDAEVGDGRRVGQAEGELEGVAGAGNGFGGGGVLADGEVGLLVEENPGGVAGAGASDDGWLEGGGEEVSLHCCQYLAVAAAGGGRRLDFGKYCTYLIYSNRNINYLSADCT